MENCARICVSTWSFHNLFAATRDPALPPLSGKPLDILDFPEMIRDRYKVHNLEVVSKHFDSIEPGYLAEFKNRMTKARSRLINIPLDFRELWEQPALSSPDLREREHAVSMYAKWIDLAAGLGTACVRCDPGRLNPADLSTTIASYRTLVSHGASKGVRIVVENHGGVASRHPEELATVLKTSGAGALPDFGNFPDDETRERGLRLLFPLARNICHAKLNSKIDFPRCMQIAKDAGYQGVFSIEAGDTGDPYQAVQSVQDELIRNL